MLVIEICSKGETRGKYFIRFGFIIIFVVIIAATYFSPIHRWADASTYFMQIDSITHDFDIKYEKVDIERAFSNRFDDLPAGLFLVKNERGDFFYGKEFTYALAASPLYIILGKQGILVFNAIMFFLMIYMGYLFLRRFNSNKISFIIANLFFLLSTIYVYIYWLSAEIYIAFLITLGFFLWFNYLSLVDNDLSGARASLFLYLAALIFGIATFAKMPNIACLLPLIICEACFRRGKNLVKILAISSLTIFALYSMFYIITGNVTPYGLQYYYVGKYPFWEGSNSNCGFGPFPVAGDLIKGQIFSFTGVRTIYYNTIYYLFGRFAGIVWYYPFIILSIFSFLGVISKKNILILDKRSNTDLARLLILIMATVNILIYLYLAYDNLFLNYFGGSHAVGNRYFYIYPAFLFLISKLEFTKKLAAAFTLVMLMSIAFVIPLIASPIETSAAPMDHTTHLPYNALPLEYTLLDSLPLWNPPSTTLNNSTFYFPQSNIRIKNGMLIINGSYPELLFKSTPRTSFGIFLQNPLGSKNVIIKSGGFKKEMILNTSQTSMIELPIDAVYKINENDYIYSLGIFIEPLGHTSNNELTIKIIDKSKYENFRYLGNWYNNENWSGTQTRWIGRNATLSVYSDKDSIAELSFQTMSFYRPRILEIQAFNMTSKTIIPTNFITITTQLPLKEGTNVIQFRIPDGCDRPSDIPKLNCTDPRCLSLTFQRIAIRSLA